MSRPFSWKRYAVAVRRAYLYGDAPHLPAEVINAYYDLPRPTGSVFTCFIEQALGEYDEAWEDRWVGVQHHRATVTHDTSVAGYIGDEALYATDEDTCTCMREQLICCPPEKNHEADPRPDCLNGTPRRQSEPAPRSPQQPAQRS